MLEREGNFLLDNPRILPQAKILISFWSQTAENQKFKIEENVMSEPVKMPVRHFLRSDYLHIFFYIKFLVFVSFVPQISDLCWKENNLSVNPLEFNFPEDHSLLAHSMLLNRRFR